jgi:hypothetical protein
MGKWYWLDAGSHAGIYYSAATTWASASAVSAIDCSSPLMALVAYPPDFLARTRGNVLRGQGSISGGMPFLSQSWIDSLEAVVITYSFSCTVRAACSTGSVKNSGLPLMALVTSPPNLLARTRGNVLGGQPPIPAGMPFFGQHWVNGLQAVVITYGFSSTVGAAPPFVPVGYDSLPLMALRAHPPDFLAGTRGNIPRSQTSILGGMPFFGKKWVDSLQTVVITYGFSSTIRAASAISPLVYSRLPLVALITSPPDFVPRIWGNVLRGQSSISGGVPLCG